MTLTSRMKLAKPFQARASELVPWSSRCMSPSRSSGLIPAAIRRNIGNADVLTFSPAGRLLKTETAAQGGNDGLVIMPDGTKYVSSVVEGGVSKIRPGRSAELIARNIPNPASMCYDSDANQLVIPMNANNALSFIKL